jgi:cytochrome c553
MKSMIVAAAVAASMLAGCSSPVPGEAADGSAAAAERPAKLGLCIGCHGESGISRIPGTPHIAGQDEAYLRRSLTHYRDNRRQGGAMNAAAGSLSERDIRELAAWYARHPWLGQGATGSGAQDAPEPGADTAGNSGGDV